MFWCSTFHLQLILTRHQICKSQACWVFRGTLWHFLHPTDCANDCECTKVGSCANVSYQAPTLSFTIFHCLWILEALKKASAEQMWIPRIFNWLSSISSGQGKRFFAGQPGSKGRTTPSAASGSLTCRKICQVPRNCGISKCQVPRHSGLVFVHRFQHTMSRVSHIERVDRLKNPHTFSGMPCAFAFSTTALPWGMEFKRHEAWRLFNKSLAQIGGHTRHTQLLHHQTHSPQVQNSFQARIA